MLKLYYYYYSYTRLIYSHLSLLLATEVSKLPGNLNPSLRFVFIPSTRALVTRTRLHLFLSAGSLGISFLFRNSVSAFKKFFLFANIFYADSILRLKKLASNYYFKPRYRLIVKINSKLPLVNRFNLIRKPTIPYYSNSKYFSSKYFSSKYFSSKYFNLGVFNSKSFNSKSFNSKSFNSKYFNSKSFNSKYFNSKYFNSKYFNSKYFNSKYFNSLVVEKGLLNYKSSKLTTPSSFLFARNNTYLNKLPVTAINTSWSSWHKPNGLVYNKFLQYFRVKVSGILTFTNPARSTINYNLRKLNILNQIPDFVSFKTSETLELLNSSRFSNFFKNPLTRKFTSFRFLNNFAFNKRRVFRKIKTFWVSKITQLSLTPARKHFIFRFNGKKFYYQKKITLFILKYYRLRVLEFLFKLEMRLINVLIQSHLVPNHFTFKLLLQGKFIFLNSTLVTSDSVTVSNNSIIQIVTSLKFLIFKKWCEISYYLELHKFFYFLRKWRERSRRLPPKTSSFRIPNWVINYKLYKEAIPHYLEVDFLTQTAVVITSPFKNFISFFGSSSLDYSFSASVRSLNWKSLS